MSLSRLVPPAEGPATVLPSMKVLFSRANCSSGTVARASCPCVSIKPAFSETHGRDARATILVAAIAAPRFFLVSHVFRANFRFIVHWLERFPARLLKPTGRCRVMSLRHEQILSETQSEPGVQGGAAVAGAECSSGTQTCGDASLPFRGYGSGARGPAQSSGREIG